MNQVSEYGAKHIKPPYEITEDQYAEMLYMLPPGAWVRKPKEESFHCIEFIAGEITAIFVMLGERYFRMDDCYYLTHDERIKKVRETFPDA